MCMADVTVLMIMKLLVVLACCIGLCYGHARFVFPRPESPNTGIKSGPCSDQNRPFEEEYIDITPGPLTIRWEETIPHVTAETRISLNKHGDEDNSCLLLDHIPHNENGRLVINSNCSITTYPLGRCVNPSYATVNIPDIECDECFLQIVSVMTDKYDIGDGLPCIQESIAYNNCSSYFSCAYVKIRPTSEGEGKDIDTCLNYYDHLIGDWPYRPSEDYVIILSSNPGVTSSATLDPFHSSVTFSISLDVLLLPASATGLRVYQRGDIVHTIYPFTVEGDHMTAQWTEVPDDVKQDFRDGVIEVSLFNNVNGEDFSTGKVLFEFENFEPGVYYGNGVHFTPAGWLPEEQFIGPEAQYPFAVHPYGAYAEERSRYFGAIIYDEPQNGVGVLTVTVTEDRGWIRGAFATSTLAGSLNMITLSNPDSAMPDLIIPGNLIIDNRIDVVLNISQQLEYIDTPGFISLVQIDTSEAEDVFGDFKEGLSAPLRNGMDHQGEAVVFLEEYGNFHYAFVVHSDESIMDVTVRGPARRGHHGDQLLDTDFEYDEELTEFFHEGVFEDLGVDMWDALWNDQIYLDVATESLQDRDRGVNGQISHPGFHYCSSIWDHTCFGGKLTVDGNEWPVGWANVRTEGVSSFSLRPGNLFQYRVTLRNVQPDEVVTSAAITLTDTVMYELSTETQPSPREDKALLLEGVVEDVSEDFIFSLERGYLELELRTTRYPDDTVEGFIPPIARQD